MKTKMMFMAVVAMMIVTTACAQSDKKLETVTIRASVICGQCKDRIETGLSYEKGVKDVVVDVEKKTVTVKYISSKTNPGEIRTELSKIGYDADDVKADPKAYAKLPSCCKKDSTTH
jgi:periplasmic mercuric ion binding protein